MGDPTRGMWPAGAGRSSPPKPGVDLVKCEAAGCRHGPLATESPEFSPASVGPRTRETGLRRWDHGNGRFYQIIHSGGGWDGVLCCWSGAFLGD